MSPPDFPELVARFFDLGLEGVQRVDAEIALTEHFFDRASSDETDGLLRARPIVAH
jgi:hypothetical protein